MHTQTLLQSTHNIHKRYKNTDICYKFTVSLFVIKKKGNIIYRLWKTNRNFVHDKSHILCAYVNWPSSSPAGRNWECYVLVLMDKERIVLVVMYYVRDCRECQVTNQILALRCWIYVEVFATAQIEEGKRGREREYGEWNWMITLSSWMEWTWLHCKHRRMKEATLL